MSMIVMFFFRSNDLSVNDFINARNHFRVVANLVIKGAYFLMTLTTIQTGWSLCVFCVKCPLVFLWIKFVLVGYNVCGR